MQRHAGRLAARAGSSLSNQQHRLPAYAAATASTWQDALPAPSHQRQHSHAAPPDHPICWDPIRQRPSAAEQQPVRGFASGTDQLSEQQYHRVAEATLDVLLEDLEAVIDDRGLEGADLEYGQGVLTLTLAGKGTYVLNKQAPNQQIWLSSPISGPVRYDCKGGDWVYARDGHLLHERLESELGELMGGPVSLSRGKP